MRKILAALLVSTLLAAPLVAFADSEPYGKQKVVYHINYDNPKQQSGAMRNIQNHINAVGKDNLDVVVVMHGNGVSLLKHADEDMNMQSKVVSLKSQNVKFGVCNNTLVGRKIDHQTALFDVDDSDIVPSGVAELSRLQQMGYTYIKP